MFRNKKNNKIFLRRDFVKLFKTQQSKESRSKFFAGFRQTWGQGVPKTRLWRHSATCTSRVWKLMYSKVLTKRGVEFDTIVMVYCETLHLNLVWGVLLIYCCFSYPCTIVIFLYWKVCKKVIVLVNHFFFHRIYKLMHVFWIIIRCNIIIL